jgi:hypothetical protein
LFVSLRSTSSGKKTGLLYSGSGVHEALLYSCASSSAYVYSLLLRTTTVLAYGYIESVDGKRNWAKIEIGAPIVPDWHNPNPHDNTTARAMHSAQGLHVLVKNLRMRLPLAHGWCMQNGGSTARCLSNHSWNHEGCCLPCRPGAPSAPSHALLTL